MESQLSEREAMAVATCELLLDRLKLVLQEETHALNQPGSGQLKSFTERKNQLLRDLLVAQRNCASPVARAALGPRVRALRPHLARNQTVLKAHMDAVKDVSAIIVDAIRQQDSDGTYSRFHRA